MRRGAGGTSGKSNIDMYVLLCVKQVTSGKLLYSTETPVWHYVMTEGVGCRKEREAQEGGDLCMADSCCCMAETNTTL